LEKNKDGFSLILKTPAQAPMGMRRRYFEPQPPVNTDTSPRRQDNIEVSSCSLSDIKVPIHHNKTPKKKKSPSCKQRDRNRRRRWKRKKKSPRSLDTRSNASPRDSDHETVQDSLCLANSNQSVVEDSLPTDFVHADTVQDKLSLAGTNANQIVEDTATSDDTVQDNLSLASDATDIDHDTVQDSLSNVIQLENANPSVDDPLCEDSVDDTLRRCFYCGCVEIKTSPLKLCTRCNFAVYCSK
jgi:hypothetical protein